MILAAVNTLLNSSQELKAYTGEQIYSVNIDQDVKGNIVVFNSETLPEDTKGGNSNDVDMLVIACVSPTYRSAAMMAKIIRGIMATSPSIPTDPSVRILGAKVESITREYDAVHKEYSHLMRINLKSKTI